MNDTKVNVNTSPPVHLSVHAGQRQTVPAFHPPIAGTKNYENLINKPSINGVVLLGDQTSADLNIVSENTSEGWAQMPLYVPKKGEICLYSDTASIKIGDGSVPLADLPSIGSGDYRTVMNALERHMQDQTIHVSREDRERWNAKLNYDTVGEELIFTRM